MPVLDVIEWANAGPNEMVHRVPEAGSGEFRLGSQLVVRDFQTAVFFHNGRAQDHFGAGRYTLSTENIPLLTSILSLPFGGKSPFRTEVYFVSLRSFLDLKWGTPQPVALRDPDLGLARLRAFGTFALQVADPALMVTKIVGGQGLFGTDDIVGYLRSIVVSRFADQLGELKVGLFDLPAHYDELSAALAANVRDDFAAVGLDLKAMYVTNISTTEETQKAIDERASMGAIGDMGKYLQYKAAQGLGQPGGAGAAGVAATGMGLGAGAGLGAMLAQSLASGMAPAGAAAAPGEPPPPPPATLETVFQSLIALVNGQLAVPAAERAEVAAALTDLQSELAAGTPDLGRIRARRDAATARWPWLADPLATAFAQPAVRAALAAAATGFLDGPAPAAPTS
jgi:membrane protease subunit (stomatin/prohibitin family)